jgi:hypothetical protein
MTKVCRDRQPRSGNFAMATKNAIDPAAIVIISSGKKRAGPRNIQTSASPLNISGMRINSNNRQMIGVRNAARKAIIKHKMVCLMGADA